MHKTSYTRFTQKHGLAHGRPPCARRGQWANLRLLAGSAGPGPSALHGRRAKPTHATLERAPNTAFLLPVSGQHCGWSYDHAGINTSPLPAAKPCPYPISDGPRAHRPQTRLRALCRPALVDAITAKRCALRCFERGRVSGRARMTLSSPSLPPPLRGPSRHPFWLCIPSAARPCSRLPPEHGGMVSWQHCVGVRKTAKKYRGHFLNQ